MHDPLRVRRFQGLRDLPGDRQRFVHRDWTAGDPLREVLALHQFHHDGAVLEAVDLRDVGVIERRQGLRFAIESRQALGISGQRLGQDLDRDLPIEPRIAGPIHLAHATDAKLSRDFVDAEPASGLQGHQGQAFTSRSGGRSCRRSTAAGSAG